jgi:uncharacterized protein (TIGR02599 family)
VDLNENVWRPPHVSVPRWRYRLMQGIQPAEQLSVFTEPDEAWKDSLCDPAQAAFPLAENVIAMVVWPRLPLSQDETGTGISSDFLYDSRAPTGIQAGQLPPEIQVTLIVIDEASAARLDRGSLEPEAIADALQDRFLKVSDFEGDLAAVQSSLNEAGVNYLVLSSPVVLRESKWSTQ